MKLRIISLHIGLSEGSNCPDAVRTTPNHTPVDSDLPKALED